MNAWLPCNLILVKLKLHRTSSVHSTHCLSGKSLRAPVNVLNEPSLWGWFHLTQTWRKKQCIILAPETTGDNLPSLPSHFTNPVRVTHCGQEKKEGEEERKEGGGMKQKGEKGREKRKEGKERRREREGEGRMGREERKGRRKREKGWRKEREDSSCN